jgi:hypothetical protein
MYQEKRERRTRTPVRQTIMITSIAALALFNFNGLALAQDDPQPSPPAKAQSTFEAHSTFRVQPTVRDLPPGVAATETRRTKAQQEFDRQLQICRDC